MRDWMLYYADRRTARRKASEAGDEVIGEILAGEDTDTTVYKAMLGAYVEHIGEQKGTGKTEKALSGECPECGFAVRYGWENGKRVCVKGHTWRVDAGSDR